MSKEREAAIMYKEQELHEWSNASNEKMVYKELSIRIAH
jgi:hypothetical protein